MPSSHDRVTILAEIQVGKLARLLVFVFVLALVTFVLAFSFSRARAQRELQRSTDGSYWSADAHSFE